MALASFAVAFAASPRPLGAEPKDAAAQDLAKKAIYTDYLATKFEDAEKKLKQAIALCGEAACGAKVKAQLHRDLGVVYVGGMNRLEEGKAEFVTALRGDSSISLDGDLASPEIEAAFAEAKKTAGIASPAPEPGTSGTPALGSSGAPWPTPPTGSDAAPPAQGDMVHTPPAEQTVLTPIPIYAELPKGITAARLQVSYKPFGATDWKTISMKRVRDGYGIEIPCLDVGSATGSLKYYIQAFDAENNIASWSGTRAQPLSVAIVTELKGEPIHLPGQPPSAKCADTGDCPPEFPGCHSHSSDGDCQGGDCQGDKSKDEPGSSASSIRKNWVSLALQQDLLFLPSSTNACSGGTPYDCFRDDESFYEKIPYDKSGGEISGGISAATTRILIGYERAFYKFTIGVRLGFAFGGGPQAPGGKSFFPIHGEGRLSYWFGDDPFGRVGLRPYIMASGGVAQVDSNVAVTVYETYADAVADRRLILDAWRKTGIGFVALGAGLLYAITSRTGPYVELRGMELLGAQGTGAGLQIGYSLGF